MITHGRVTMSVTLMFTVTLESVTRGIQRQRRDDTTTEPAHGCKILVRRPSRGAAFGCHLRIYSQIQYL